MQLWEREMREIILEGSAIWHDEGGKLKKHRQLSNIYTIKMNKNNKNEKSFC